MSHIGRSLLCAGVVAVAGLIPASSAKAQFGLNINTPGVSVGVGTSAYYPPYYAPAPIVVAPAPIYVPRPYPYYAPPRRPYYGPGYGYGRGGYYGGRPGGYYGGRPGGYYGGRPGGPYRY